LGISAEEAMARGLDSLLSEIADHVPIGVSARGEQGEMARLADIAVRCARDGTERSGWSVLVNEEEEALLSAWASRREPTATSSPAAPAKKGSDGDLVLIELDHIRVAPSCLTLGSFTSDIDVSID